MNVLLHNIAIGARWSAAGKAYEEISLQIADSIQHAVDRLAPSPGEKVLDLATGTGYTARKVAALGAETTGVDIASEQIAAARELSPPSVRYQVGDAESLPFDDGAFDAVISTCGIQFASRPESAAAELSRVIHEGGRFAATIWTDDSAVAEMFQIVSKYIPSNQKAEAPPSPFKWGREERIRELLGSDFDLEIETGISRYRTSTAADAWRAFRNSYGPIKAIADSLEPDALKALASEFITFHKQFETPSGLVCPRKYFLVVGRK